MPNNVCTTTSNYILALINPIPYTAYAISFGMKLDSPTLLFSSESWTSASSNEIFQGLLYGIPQYIVIMLISAYVLPKTAASFVSLCSPEHESDVFSLIGYSFLAITAAIVSGVISWEGLSAGEADTLIFAGVATASFIIFNFLTRFVGSKNLFELTSSIFKPEYTNELMTRASLRILGPSPEDHLIENIRGASHRRDFNWALYKERFLHYFGLACSINTVFTWPIFAAQGTEFLKILGAEDSGWLIFLGYVISASSWLFYAASAYKAPLLLDLYIRRIGTDFYEPGGCSLRFSGSFALKLLVLASFYLAPFSIQGLADHTLDSGALDYLFGNIAGVGDFFAYQAHINTSLMSIGATLPLLLRAKQPHVNHTERMLVNSSLSSGATEAATLVWGARYTEELTESPPTDGTPLLTTE